KDEYADEYVGDAVDADLRFRAEFGLALAAPQGADDVLRDDGAPAQQVGAVDRHRRRQHPCYHQPFHPRAQQMRQQRWHGVHRVGMRSKHGKGGNSPEHGQHAAAEEDQARPAEDLFAELGAFHRHRAHGSGLPAGVHGGPQDHLPHDVAPAIGGVAERAEALPAHLRAHRMHHGSPSHVPDAINGHDDGAHAERDVLDEIGDDDREHAADNGVEQLDQENRRHRQLQVLERDAGEDDEKAALDAQEHPHVEDAAGGHQDAGEYPQAAAVLALEVFGHRHQFEGAEAMDDESGPAYADHHQP